ncbi:MULTISPECIES: type VI secretion system protein TssA [unclassified Pseudomonas]|uniref:type VI secretion system protein TssA n=1 Tax=unclassified Pseudomonas TaxID=196821 RepID=UPI0009E722FC|nr:MULTISPECIES: type VI secretion system protein TssA [unclassified Pseudomonas]RAG99211.1 type VI secretion system protein TssA [Pseudomonas sp. Leaf98]
MDYSGTLCGYYIELALVPCSPGNFAGADMRFSSEYEALEAELGKLQSMHVSTQPDWQAVMQISEGLLRQHTKDLRVAAWLTWALYQRESFPGLLAGLGLMRHLCEHHWAVVYPQKMRTRGAALGWLALRLEQVFAHSVSLKDQQPLFRCMLEHLAHLDRLWSAHLSDEAPLLLPLRRQLTQRLEQAAQAALPEAVSAGVVAQVKQAATRLLSPEPATGQEKTGNPAIASEKEAHKSLRTLQEHGRHLCNWWLRQDATDLRALRLNRALTWLALNSYPDADSDRLTVLRGPTPDKLKRYRERFAQGHYGELLLELEASLAGALFWFDGLRMVWECLEALQADLAMTELEVSFALLLQRLPDLPEFRFHEGAPFADTATRDWITLQVARHLQPPAPSGVVVDASAEPWEAALQEVMPRLRKDGLKEAIHELKQGMHSARSERARFHWRLALARLCVSAGKHELAKVQLEGLDHELQRAGLDRWEPELALQVAQLLYRCCELLPQNQAIRERKETTHRRLCHFDVEAVLE